MKKIISIFLIMACLATVLVLPATAATDPVIAIPAGRLEKKFVVDGNLDIWYLSEEDDYANGDSNYYQYVALSPTEKSDGVTYYGDPVTFAQAWTAWDDDYVYIYLKVWDNELAQYSPKLHEDSSYADSLEIWFDPDPDSRTHDYIYDENGNIIDHILKEDGVTDVYLPNDPYQDAAQGDVHLRVLAYDMERTFYEDIVKPNYGDVTFGQWVNDPQNVCTFTFQGQPMEIEETGLTVTCGYGVEARFPRRDDLSNSYQIQLVANNSSENEWEEYALTTGEAWWMRYDTAWSVDYVDNAPFFNQSAAQLATKGVVYTDSEINVNGPAGAVVKKINGLRNVTEADKEKVMALKAEYDALTVLEQGYVQYKNYAVLIEAVKAVNGGVVPVDPDQQAADEVVAKIDALNVRSLDDEDDVVAARSAYDHLTEKQKPYVYNLYKLEQAEKRIAELRAQAEKDAADKQVAQSVIDLIDTLPQPITLADKDKVTAAREAYDGLTKDQKEWVTNYPVLRDAEQAITDLEKSEADKQAALAVEGMIEAIPVEVTLDVKEIVDSARSAYNDLTDLQKTLVGNYQKLVDAEKVIADLENPVVPPAPQVVYGDIDGDGKVTAADALEVLKSVVGKTTLTDEQFTAADTDGNDKADAADALNMLKKVVGKIDKFPVED